MIRGNDLRYYLWDNSMPQYHDRESQNQNTEHSSTLDSKSLLEIHLQVIHSSVQ